jgi:hypothetical protein
VAPASPPASLHTTTQGIKGTVIQWYQNATCNHMGVSCWVCIAS